MKANGTARTTLELEARVVGAILRDSDAIHELPAGFTAETLSPDWRGIFATLDQLSRAKKLHGGRVDHDLIITEGQFTDAIRTSLTWAEQAAADVLLRKTTIRDHAAALLDRQRRALLIEDLRRAAIEIEQGGPLVDISAEVVSKLLDIDSPDRPEVISYKDAAIEAVDVVERIQKGKDSVLRTGFPRLDSILRIRPGNLIVLASRSKVGKTTFGRQIADGVALRKQHVLMHSFEMNVAEMVALDLSSDASLDSTAFFDEQEFTSDEWDAIMRALEKRTPDGGDGYLHANHHYPSLGAICRISEKMHRKHRLALIVVDYLQLTELDLGRGASREVVVSTISRTLKRLAERLGVPVLALAQLNREAAREGMVRSRKKKAEPKKKIDPMKPQLHLAGAEPEAEEKEPAINWEAPDAPSDRAPPPQLHHLRESGAIEQDANAVVFLHHPYAETGNAWQRKHGPFELIIAAQRLGPTGSVRLFGERHFSRFREYDP